MVFAQLLQLRFGSGHRFAQHAQFGRVAADVLGQFLQLALRLIARLVQAMREFALMLDLLLDTRQGATDLVDIGLCLGHRFGGFFAAHAAGFDACFGIALLGNQLLQACLFLIQLLAQALQPTIQAAVFQRLPLGILDPALFLQRLVLLGLPRLALQMRQLLGDFFAQVAQTVEVFARMPNPRFGFLAAFLVLGNAGGFFQIHAQVFRACFDDLADHALLDDRVAARPKAGAQEQIGDVAAPALGAIEVVGAIAVATDQALDRNLVERGELATDGVVGVVEDQLHRRLRHRLACRRAGKDHVGQRIAT